MANATNNSLVNLGRVIYNDRSPTLLQKMTIETHLICNFLSFVERESVMQSCKSLRAGAMEASRQDLAKVKSCSLFALKMGPARLGRGTAAAEMIKELKALNKGSPYERPNFDGPYEVAVAPHLFQALAAQPNLQELEVAAINGITDGVAFIKLVSKSPAIQMRIEKLKVNIRSQYIGWNEPKDSLKWWLTGVVKEACSRLPNLSTLTLSGSMNSYGYAIGLKETLTSHPNLVSLDLTQLEWVMKECFETSQPFSHIRALSLPTLRSSSHHYSCGEYDDALIARAFPGLTELNYVEAGYSGIKTLLQELPSLRKIKFHACLLGTPESRYNMGNPFAEVPHQLTHLDFSYKASCLPQEIINIISHCKHLTHLSVAFGGSFPNVRLLANFVELCPTLEDITCDKLLSTPEELETLLASSPSLKRIHIGSIYNTAKWGWSSAPVTLEKKEGL